MNLQCTTLMAFLLDKRQKNLEYGKRNVLDAGKYCMLKY